MQKHLALVFLSVFSVLALQAQVTIKGTLIDKATNQPIGYASVGLYQNDKPLAGTLSSEEGTFELVGVKPGVYAVKATFIGYKDVEKKISITGKSHHVHIGKMLMEEDAKMLKEVEVVAQGSQARFDIDKKVFSVDQSIAAAGGDASEVLQGIPSVEVDNDGEITLRNSSNVEIWINGKPSGLTEENRAQILEQIPAENIESVEIITNPSAKFSPEGSAGVINLVMKKDRKAGYYGSVNAGLEHAVHSDRLGERAGINLNFNKGRWDGYANFGFRNNYNGNETDVDRYYLDANGDTTSTMYQDTRQLRQRIDYTTRLGLNYAMTDKQTVGFSAYLMARDFNYDSRMNYSSFDNATSSVSRRYRRTVDGDRSPLSCNFTLDHSWNIDKSSSLVSSLSYSHYGDNKKYNYLQTGYNDQDQNQLNDANNNTYEFKSDYEKTLLRKHKLQAGVDVRYQNRHSVSEVDNLTGNVYERDPLLHNNYTYAEQLYAGYVTFGSRINNFSYQLGLRGEYIVIDNKTNGISNPQKTYFEPFPTLFLSYSLPHGNEIQLNYTRRINRPRGRQLNSYRDISDSTNITFGNPDLEPEYVNALELNYIKSWEAHTFSASAYYRYTDNVVNSYQFLDVNGIINTSYLNVSSNQKAGGEFVLKDAFTRWLSLTSTLNLYYEKFQASDFDAPRSQISQPVDDRIHLSGSENFSWSAKMLGNVMFTKTFSGQMTGSYTSARVVTQGKTKGVFTLDMGLRKTFWDRKVSVAFTVRDMLNSRKNERTTSSSHFRQHYKNVPFGPQFRLTGTYNFGNAKKKAKRNRDGGPDEENTPNSTSDEMPEEF